MVFGGGLAGGGLGRHYDVNLSDIDHFISQDGFQKSLGNYLGDLKQAYDL